MNNPPKIVIHDRPDKSYGPRGKAKPCVFCWFYDPMAHEIVRFPAHMKQIQKAMGTIPGFKVERTRAKLEKLLVSA